MELRDYVKIIGKRIWLLVVIVLAITFLSYLFSYYSPTTYDASASVEIMVKRDQGNSNQYDDYYAFQASSYYADAAISWLKDAANISKISDSTSATVQNIKNQDISNMIKAKKLQPSTVAININSANQQEAQALIDSTLQLINNRSQVWAKEDVGKDFQLIVSGPVVSKHIQTTTLNTLIGFVVGIVVGLAMVFLVEYFSKKS